MVTFALHLTWIFLLFSTTLCMCLPVRGPNTVLKHTDHFFLQDDAAPAPSFLVPYKILSLRHQLGISAFSLPSGFQGLCSGEEINSGLWMGIKEEHQKTGLFPSEGKYKSPQQKCRFLQKTTQLVFFIFHEKCIFLIFL